MALNAPAPRGEGEGESADLFDYAALKDYLGFVLRGVLRHRVIALATFAITASLALTAAGLYPKTYRVQTKILAQRNQVMASLGNPHRSMPHEADAPTRAAQETVLRRDNLVSLVKQTNLIERWKATRAPLLKAKDAVLGVLRGRPDDDEQLDAMVGLLEKRIRVRVDQTSVTISIEFPNAELAYQLVEAAQQNFLETQHVMEVSAIAEAISILEVHASQAHDTVEVALQDVVKVREQRRKTGSKAPLEREFPEPKAAAAPRGKGPVVNQAELTQLRFLIRAKRRAIEDLEEFRSRRLSELNSQLAEQRVQYSNQHPVVLDTQQRISAMQQVSPQVVALKRDEAELLSEYRAKGGLDPNAQVEPSAMPRILRRQETAAVQVQVQGPELSLSDDPEVAYAEGVLKTAQAKYDDLVMRIDAARIELDTARAAFKYRYSVINPAQMPKNPTKPNVPLLMFGGLVVAGALALFVGAALDLYRGRFVEPWQIQRTLGLRVLAEVGKK